MPQVTLRPATIEDAGFAFVVEEDAMKVHAVATWGHWLPAADPAGYVTAFVPEGQSVIQTQGWDIGVLATEDRPDCLYLAKLYLLSAHRGIGIGSTLIRHLQQQALERALPLRLHSLRVNERAIAFYTKHGFAVSSSTAERVFMSYGAA